MKYQNRRYFDPNPLAGYLEIRWMFFYIKLMQDGGILHLSFPVGKDALFWNAHRVYGGVRLPLATANFQVQIVKLLPIKLFLRINENRL